jgi:hypothetical protein
MSSVNVSTVMPHKRNESEAVRPLYCYRPWAID